MIAAADKQVEVHRDEIYLVDGNGKVILLYHPFVNITVALTPGGDVSARQTNEADGSSSSSGIAEAVATAPTEMTLPTELGPTADETALATVRYARDRIAAAVGIAPASAAVLSVGGVDSADLLQVWVEVGAKWHCEVNLDATLEDAGIVDGAELIIHRRGGRGGGRGGGRAAAGAAAFEARSAGTSTPMARADLGRR